MIYNIVARVTRKTMRYKVVNSFDNSAPGLRRVSSYFLCNFTSLLAFPFSFNSLYIIIIGITITLETVPIIALYIFNPSVGKSAEPWCTCNWMSLMAIFALCPVFFRTTLLCSGGYHLERGQMRIRNAVGIRCEKCATTEMQGTGVWPRGVYVWWLYVCHLHWHDYPSLLEEESRHIIINIISALKSFQTYTFKRELSCLMHIAFTFTD